MHHHRTGAEQQRRRPIEERYRVVTCEAVGGRGPSLDVAGQGGEDEESDNYETEVPQSVDRLSQQASVHPLAPAGYLTDRLLVGGRWTPSGQADQDEADHERPESAGRNPKRGNAGFHAATLGPAALGELGDDGGV